LEGVGAQRVLFERPEAFANLNTRADLAAITERVARGEIELDGRA
jgi:molybdopterin-guanine dinucleotide biosynthesis protein A